MDTQREVVYNLRHFFNKEGFTSDETSLSDKGVIYHLLKSRAVILKDRFKKGEEFSQQMFQTIPCIKLVEADRADCPTIPISGCKWLKSKEPIPTPILINSVSSSLGNLKASYTPWDRVQDKLNSRIEENRSDKYYTFKDTTGETYLYLYNEEDLENITITGIFEDPVEASIYCGVNEEIKCNPIDSSFYTESYYLDPIVKLSAQTITNYRSVATVDQLNDDSSLK